MAAHIRKTNPRNDLGPRGPNGIVNRFRILRRGIPYVSHNTLPSNDARDRDVSRASYLKLRSTSDSNIRATKSKPIPTAPAAYSSSAIKAPSATASLSSKANGPTSGILSGRESVLTPSWASLARANRLISPACSRKMRKGQSSSTP